MRYLLTVFLITAVAVPLGNACAQTSTVVVSPEIKQSLALRTRHGVPTPEGTEAIYVHSIAVHHIREEFSTVATRALDGRWSVSRAGEEGPGLLRIEERLIPETTRTLSEEEGRVLDQLLWQPSTYHQKSSLPRNPYIGAAFYTMEIETPMGRTVLRWTGKLGGKAGAVADLVIGRS